MNSLNRPFGTTFIKIESPGEPLGGKPGQNPGQFNVAENAQWFRQPYGDSTSLSQASHLKTQYPPVASAGDSQCGLREWEIELKLAEFFAGAGPVAAMRQVGVVSGAVVAAGAEVFHVESEGQSFIVPKTYVSIQSVSC
jgi:hypothetical protein